MALFDLPVDDLRRYRSPSVEPADFDAFWAKTLTDREPHREVGLCLRAHRGRAEQTTRTLAYFDGVHFAARCRAPALFSVALEDQTCPPSTVFAAFNAYGYDDKRIEIYDFNDHEGGGPFQEAVQLWWLPEQLS